MEDFFSQNLQKIMDEIGCTRYRLAKEIGCHPTSVTNWIEGKMKPQPAMLKKIGYFLGYFPDTLFEPEPRKMPVLPTYKSENGMESGFKYTEEDKERGDKLAALRKQRDEIQKEIDELNEDEKVFAERLNREIELRMTLLEARMNAAEKSENIILKPEEKDLVLAWRRAAEWQKTAVRKMFDLREPKQEQEQEQKQVSETAGE